MLACETSLALSLLDYLSAVSHDRVLLDPDFLRTLVSLGAAEPDHKCSSVTMSENDHQNFSHFGEMIIPDLELPNRDSASPPKAQVDSASLQQAMDKNKESLKVKLMTRRPINQLVEQGILPSLKVTPHFYHQRQKLERAKTGDFLKNKIQRRPDRQELIQQHILEDTTVDPSLHDKQRQLKKARLADDLNDRLSHRPGPLELVKGNILQADEKFAQAVKEGQIQFKRTCEGQSLRHPPPSFVVEEDSGSDVALSPPQDSTQDQPVNGLPSVDSMVSSPYSSVDSPTSQAEPKSVLRSPVSSSPSSQCSSTSHSDAIYSVPTVRVRKKSKPKSQPKPRTIKFHEYKGPPSAQKNQVSSANPSETSYELLLKQQQLFLQWQLEWQQKYPQMILPVTQKPKMEQKPASNHGTVKELAQETVSVPATKTWSKLEDMKVSDLKAELKKRNLPVSGSKPQLIERLKAYKDVAISVGSKVPIASLLDSNTVITSEPATRPLNVSSIILDKLPTLAPKSEPLTSVVAMDTTPVNAGDTGSLVVYNTVPVHGQLMVSRPSSVAPMEIETSTSDTLDSSSDVNSTIAINENIVKLQQRKIQELQRELQKSQMQLQQQQWLQHQQQQQALLASHPVPIATATVNQLQIPVTSIANTLPQVNTIDADALQKLQQHLQQKFQQQQLLQHLQQTNNGNPVFPAGSSVSAAVKANLAAFIHNQQNAGARLGTTNPAQTITQLSSLQPIMLCQSDAFASDKPRANSLPNGFGQPRTSSLPNFSAVLKVKPAEVATATKQTTKGKQDNRSQNNNGSTNKRSGSRKSVKCQAVDDVLEILIKNGELPPSAAQVPSTPTTPETQKSDAAAPPAFPTNPVPPPPPPPPPLPSTSATNTEMPPASLNAGRSDSPVDFDFQLDLNSIEPMDLGMMDHHTEDSTPMNTEPGSYSNEDTSSKAMEMELTDWLDVLSSPMTNPSSSNFQPMYNCGTDPLLSNMVNGHDNFDMFSLDHMDFKTAADDVLNWDKTDFAT